MDSYEGWWFPLLLIAVIYFWGDIWNAKWRYALYYDVDSSHVSIEKEPHDCDFLKAPIGNKECHYRRVVSTVEIARSTTQTPIESFNGGKTWYAYTPDPGASVPQYPTMMNVTVTWERVED